MPRRIDWDRVRSAFVPDEVLAGERAAAFYCEREHNPFQRICIDFRPTESPGRPPIAFVTGHRGSGKSSLLVRLLEHFKDDYFVVYFDIGHNLDRTKTNQIDLLYLLGATVFQVGVQEKVRPDPKYLRCLAESVYTLTYESRKKAKEESLNVVELTRGLLCFGASMVGAALAEKLADALLKPFTLASGVSEEVARKREIEPRLQAIIDNVNLILADVQTRSGKPLLVLVDGLDKLPRLEQANLIFLESRALLGPVCRIIYTVPMFVYNSLAFGQVGENARSYLLPNIKLYSRTSDDDLHRPGHKTLREMVSKRVQSLDVTVRDVFGPGALELLIRKSGGVVRWLVGLVQGACTQAEILHRPRIDLRTAQRAVADFRGELSMRLTGEMIEELREVRRKKRPSGSKLSSELLDGLLIVAYRNDTAWFDAHPLVWDELGEPT